MARSEPFIMTQGPFTGHPVHTLPMQELINIINSKLPLDSPMWKAASEEKRRRKAYEQQMPKREEYIPPLEEEDTDEGVDIEDDEPTEEEVRAAGLGFDSGPSANSVPLPCGHPINALTMNEETGVGDCSLCMQHVERVCQVAGILDGKLTEASPFVLAEMIVGAIE
jgi:hypothetical protein